MKKHLVLLLLTVFSLHFAGCTSSDEATSEDAAVTDESLENVEGTDTAASPEANAEGFSDEVGSPATEAPAGDALAEAPPVDGAAPADGAAPPAEGELPPPMDAMADSGAPPAGDTAFVPDAGVDPAADTALPPPAEEIPPSVADASSVSEPPSAPTETAGSGIFEEKPKKSPVKKIESTPFRLEGVLLNAVYIARPGDNFSKVSKMIYGDNKKSKELRKVNPGVSPKVGDKIYYNSPARPEDEANMKVYYEDAGMPAETYVSKEGESIRDIAKSQLGFSGAWKEVFATNNVESTRKIPAGTELKFWKGSGASSMVAANAPTADTAAAGSAAPADIPPPPADMPPPAMEDPMAAGGMETPPPPPADMPPPDMMAENAPPPPQEMAPPPPPPPPEMAPPPPPPPTMAATGPGDEGSGNDDLMLALAGGGGVAALLAGLMVMRKRRQQREMAAAFGDTQVGT